MLAVPEEQQRIPMPFEAWMEFDPGEGYRTEWVDGIAIVTPPASIPHGRALANVTVALKIHLPHLDVIIEPGAHVAPTKYREPDVAVYEVFEDGVFTEQAPVIVVEILSPSTRREDLVRKREEYLAAGAGQYWILDPAERWAVVYGSTGPAWQVLLELDDQHPTGEVAVAGHGAIPLDLAALLGT